MQDGMGSRKLAEIWGGYSTLSRQTEEALRDCVIRAGLEFRYADIPFQHPGVFAARSQFKLTAEAFGEALNQEEGVRATLESSDAWRPDSGTMAWLAKGFTFGELWWLYQKYSKSVADETLDRFKDDTKRLKRASNVLGEAAELIRWSLGIMGAFPIVSQRTAGDLQEASQMLAPSDERVAELIACQVPGERIQGYSEQLADLAETIRRRRGRPTKTLQKQFAKEWAKTAKEKTGACLDAAGLKLYSIIFSEHIELKEYARLREGGLTKKSKGLG